MNTIQKLLTVFDDMIADMLKKPQAIVTKLFIKSRSLGDSIFSGKTTLGKADEKQKKLQFNKRARPRANADKIKKTTLSKYKCILSR